MMTLPSAPGLPSQISYHCAGRASPTGRRCTPSGVNRMPGNSLTSEGAGTAQPRARLLDGLPVHQGLDQLA